MSEWTTVSLVPVGSSTITIQIGNTDNKLSQYEWSRFCHAVKILLKEFGYAIHFEGYPPGDAPWQNAAWVAQTTTGKVEDFKLRLGAMARLFGQTSIAVTEGITRFI